MDKFDVCIVGAGVIGLAIAHQLAIAHRGTSYSIVVLEQESGFGQHTSSRNSEVIHAGIYYQPASLKATLCVRGKHLLYEHCETHQLPFKRIGKYIVAQQGQEDSLQQLAHNAVANGVDDLILVDQAKLRLAEPAVSAKLALYSPSTGIIDSHAFMQSLLHLSQNNGVVFAPFTRVDAIEAYSGEYRVTAAINAKGERERYRFRSQVVINCAGLQASAVATAISTENALPVPRTYYCKGDYFTYTARSPLQHLIYPIPEANSAGLGVHATLDLAGQLRFGPDTQYIDALRYDIDAAKATTFARAISSYFPGITPAKLIPAYSGIRPKLVPAGAPASDFQIQNGRDCNAPGLIQLFGIESPGLTASLAIGEHVSKLVTDLLA